MKNILVVMLLMVFFSIMGYCQKDSTRLEQIIINMPETVTVKTLNEEKIGGFFSEKSMPWIVALLIGLTSAGINYYVAKRNENNLKLQMNNANVLAERQYKLQLATTIEKEWVNNLRIVVADLITVTDPDYNEGLDVKKMLTLVNQAQILLDDSNESEDILNRLITELAMACTYEKNSTNPQDILTKQAKITKQIRKLIREKQASLTSRS